MAIIVKAHTLSGGAIEGARWMVEFPSGVQEGQSVALNVPVPSSEANLLNYLSRSQSVDAMLDKSDNVFTVSLSCKVTRVRHMVDTADGTVETMCHVQPANRLAEHVLVYLFAPSKSDPKFLRMVRGGLTDSSSG